MWGGEDGGLRLTLRHSGSATSFETLSSSGSSLGRKGAASWGFSTSLAMLSMMTADLRLMAVARSRRPRTSRGTMMDRGGPSTWGGRVQSLRSTSV